MTQQLQRRNSGPILLCLALMLVPLFSSCGPNDVAKPPSDVAKPAVHRVPVTSTNLQSVGYDSHSRILTIEFRNGAVYEYAGVPPEVHDELMSAISHGRYFHNRVRSAGFTASRVQ